MKKAALAIIEYIVKKLQLIQLKYKVEYNIEIPYSSLSPIDNGDEDGHYSEALKWALKNRKKQDIKNIALTGPYGSGKSSILKTFQKNYTGNDLKFLSISLATFKEEKPQLDDKGNEIKVDKTDLLRLIETSILEQIFYHEEDKKIPDSRFKKIKSYNSSKLYLLSIGYSLFLLSIYNYFNPTFIQSTFKHVVISDVVSTVINYTGILIIMLGLFFIILKSVRIISALTINKLQIQNAEIGIGDNQNKSILNHHIDEILYFFSIRPYNVVIIEDLDRFQETEIFTKLREVNLLLNKSEKTKRKEIVFVYAVRDDMFTDKERTKFFDFIIPVIPVINSSNSSEILLKKKNIFQITENLIEDISFFIDDMRLLHNISNEFYLYREKLNEHLNPDKLFALITYKNIYPNDFMKLSNSEGNLFKIFTLKTTFIKNMLDGIDSEIEKYKSQIQDLENIFTTNLKDLRLLYIIRVVESLPGFKSFIINNEEVSMDEASLDDKFQYIKTDKYKYSQVAFNEYNNRIVSRQMNFVTKFVDIEKRVDKLKLYSVREKEVIDIKNGKITSLKEKIQEAEKQKKKIRNYKISQLIQSDKVVTKGIIESINNNFIDTLLRNGYIAEDYIDYISLFHEESITRSDYQFHINLKNSNRQPFEYKLTKVEKLISKINLLDFQTDYILNYDLLNYLLAFSDKYVSQLELFFDKLKDESKLSIEFIKGYFEISQSLDKFTKMLCAKWTNIWGFMEDNSDFSELSKKRIFKNIIEFGDIKDVLKISKQSTFKKHILSDSLFLSTTDNYDVLKKVIQELFLVFEEIDFESSPDEMLDFIYENNFYELNPQMVASIIKKFGDFRQIEFDNSNYFAIKSSKADKLIEYIDGNTNDYISNVYLKISTNINEKEEYLIELLNNKNINVDNKVSVISQVLTKVTNLSDIADSELYSTILDNNRLVASWKNLLHEYQSQHNQEGEGDIKLTISDSTISFINSIENAEELSRVKVPAEVNNENLYGEFWKKLIQVDAIEDSSYNLITKSNSWWYSNLSFESLSVSKIKSLIDNNCINPIANSFNLIKERSDGLNIYLLEKRKGDYFKILDQLTFDSEDLELILKSATLTNLEKLKILNTCSEETIITDINLKALSPLIFADVTFTVADKILESIILNNKVPTSERLGLFIRNSDKYDLPLIESFLNNLGGDYARITDTSTKARIPRSQQNWELLNILTRKGYISSFSDKESDFRVNHKRN